MNHGVSSSLLAKLKHDMLEFYELPMEEKMKYKIKPGDVEGYGAVARSDAKLDWGDRVYMITNPIQRRKSHLLPELPSSLRFNSPSFFRPSVPSIILSLYHIHLSVTIYIIFMYEPMLRSSLKFWTLVKPIKN